VLLPEKTSVRERHTPYCPVKVFGGSGDYIFTSRDTSVGKKMILRLMFFT
jgi:hypothetical protein